MPDTQWKKKLASHVMPKHSHLVELVNNNAKVASWLKANEKLPKFDVRTSLYQYINREILHGEPIDYLEFGVFEGESIKFWAGENDRPNSRFYGFDTFSGLPEDWNTNRGKGAFDVGLKVPDISDERVDFLTGLFQDTLPGFLETFKPQSRLVIHNDSDLYSSTLFTLASLDRLTVPGTIIIFDEFSSPLAEFRAWSDYLSAFMRRAKPIGMTVNYGEQVAFEFQ